MEMHIEVDGTAKALNERDGSCFPNYAVLSCALSDPVRTDTSAYFAPLPNANPVKAVKKL